MRYEDALRIIENRKKTKGYYVRYSYRAGGFEGHGYIPEPYLEEPFGSRAQAYAFARAFKEYSPSEFYSIYPVQTLVQEGPDA